MDATAHRAALTAQGAGPLDPRIGADARVSHPDEPAELQARDVARRVARGNPVAPLTASAEGMVARQAVVRRANARAQQLTVLQGQAIEGLKSARLHLTTAAGTYELGYKDFSDTLKEADKDHAREQTANDILQDILIGTAVGLIGPAGVAARLAVPAAASAGRVVADATRAKIRGFAATATAKVLEGLVDEGLEPVANWGVDAASTQSPAPSGTAGLAGPEPGTQYKSALGQLGELIAYLPNLMPLQSLHHRLVDLALEAGERGEPALVDIVTWLDSETRTLASSLTGLTGPFLSLVKAIMSSPVHTRSGVERMLWSEWVPRLHPPFDELNYLVVRNRLESVGLSSLFRDTIGPMTGPYAGDQIVPKSAQRIHTNARANWLDARSVPVDPNNDSLVHMLFHTANAMEILDRARLVDRRGTFTWPDKVMVGGATYPLAIDPDVGPYPPRHVSPGDPVIVESVWPSWDFLRRMADKYLKDGRVDHPLTSSDVGVEVLWDHGRGTRYRPYGPL